MAAKHDHEKFIATMAAVKPVKLKVPKDSAFAVKVGKTRLLMTSNRRIELDSRQVRSYQAAPARLDGC